MARIKLEQPDAYIFSTDIAVQITDLNYGGHLGNDSLLSILHESRVQFFQSLGKSEVDFFGTGVIMSDVAIEYKAEGFYRDILQVEIAVTDISRTGFDVFYRVRHKQNDKLIALAKTGIVCFNYETRRVMPVPEAFLHSIAK